MVLEGKSYSTRFWSWLCGPASHCEVLFHSPYEDGHWFLDSFLSGLPSGCDQSQPRALLLYKNPRVVVLPTREVHMGPWSRRCCWGSPVPYITWRDGVYVTSSWISACWWQLQPVQCSRSDSLWCLGFSYKEYTAPFWLSSHALETLPLGTQVPGCAKLGSWPRHQQALRPMGPADPDFKPLLLGSRHVVKKLQPPESLSAF